MRVRLRSISTFFVGYLPEGSLSRLEQRCKVHWVAAPFDIPRLQLQTTDTGDRPNFCTDCCPPAPSWPADWSRWGPVLSTSPHGSCILSRLVRAKRLAVSDLDIYRRYLLPHDKASFKAESTWENKLWSGVKFIQVCYYLFRCLFSTYLLHSHNSIHSLTAKVVAFYY